MSLTGKLAVATGTPSDYYYDDFVVNAGDEGGITIVDTSSGQSALAFGDGTSGNDRYEGRVLYDHSTDTLRLGAAGQIQADITATGLSLTGNLHTSVHDYGTTADINVDFNEDALQKATLNGNVAIDTAAANKGAGKSIVIKILCDGSARNFTWNSSWVFIGEKPTSIAASKTAILSMTCFGTNETDVICSYAVQD